MFQHPVFTTIWPAGGRLTVSACSRALMSMMRELGYQIGRFKVRNLMKEAGQVAVGIT